MVASIAHRSSFIYLLYIDQTFVGIQNKKIFNLLMHSSIVFHNDVGDLLHRKKENDEREIKEEEEEINYFLHIT
jgi:hypothetical protein